MDALGIGNTPLLLLEYALTRDVHEWPLNARTPRKIVCSSTRTQRVFFSFECFVCLFRLRFLLPSLFLDVWFLSFAFSAVCTNTTLGFRLARAEQIQHYRCTVVCIKYIIFSTARIRGIIATFESFFVCLNVFYLYILLFCARALKHRDRVVVVLVPRASIIFARLPRCTVVVRLYRCVPPVSGIPALTRLVSACFNQHLHIL